MPLGILDFPEMLHLHHLDHLKPCAPRDPQSAAVTRQRSEVRGCAETARMALTPEAAHVIPCLDRCRTSGQEGRGAHG